MNVLVGLNYNFDFDAMIRRHFSSRELKQKFTFKNDRISYRFDI